MNANLSILSLVLHASPVVQFVMLLLMAVSVASWAAIFRKLFALKRVRSLNDAFEREFWSGTSLNDLYSAAAQNAKNAGPMERIFASGMREYQKLRERRIADPGTLLDGARRAMRASYQRELDAVESNLSFLASVGSVSPYLGLFGTVWGIMGALTSISKSGSASLDVVAGPIGEALIATAVGIAVAVPAVVGYNFFIRRNKVVWAFLDDFAIDFVHLALKASFIIERNGGKASASARLTGIDGKKTAVKGSHDTLLAAGEAHA